VQFKSHGQKAYGFIWLLGNSPTFHQLLSLCFFSMLFQLQKLLELTEIKSVRLPTNLTQVFVIFLSLSRRMTVQ